MPNTDNYIGVPDARSLEEYKINARKPKTDMGKNEFLHLLVTQLSNQDPTQPSDNTEFIAQLAQFTSLEQMQQMNANTVNAQAFSLIGQHVYAEMPSKTDASKPVPVFGQIKACEINSGIVQLIVTNEDNKDYGGIVTLDKVVNLMDAEFFKEWEKKAIEELNKGKESGGDGDGTA